MKQPLDEIQAPRRIHLDPTHLLAFTLGGVIVAALSFAAGRDREPNPMPLRSGLLSYVSEQDSPNSRTSNTFNEGDGVRGQLFEGYLLIEYPNSVEVVPAHRLLEVRFRR